MIRPLTSIFSSIALLVPFSAQAQKTQYDCQAEKQIVLMSKQTKWNYNAGDVDKASRETFKWTFLLEKGEDGSTVSHDAGILDAIGLAGTHEAVFVAPGQFAFATKKDGNCLFTEQACGALVEISDINKSKASFSLVPMGSVLQEDGSREILQMIMLGTCKRKEVAQ